MTAQTVQILQKRILQPLRVILRVSTVLMIKLQQKTVRQIVLTARMLLMTAVLQRIPRQQQ